MKKNLIPVLTVALLALCTAPAFAQSAEDMVLGQTGVAPLRKGSEAAANATYGDPFIQDGGDYSEGQEPENATDDGVSYDQAAIGTDGPQDIYSYVGRERAGTDPAARREANARAAHTAELARRKEVLDNMKSSSQKYLQEQKIRAWKLAHPGEEYPNEEDMEENGDPNASINPDGYDLNGPDRNKARSILPEDGEGYAEDGDSYGDDGGEVAATDANDPDDPESTVNESGAETENN